MTHDPTLLQTAIPEFELLDDLLRRWHEHQSAYRAERALPSRDATCRDAASSRVQWDESSTAILDEQTHGFEMGAVEASFDSLSGQHRAAVQQWMLIDASGVAVWCNPRLPTGDALMDLMIAAKREMRRLLIKRSVFV